MNHSEALKLALDTLGKFSIGYHVDAVELNDLIATLEAALEQPNEDYERGFVDGMSEQAKRSVDRAVNRMADALEQEPEHSPNCALLKIPSRDCDCQTDTHPAAEEDEPVAWQPIATAPKTGRKVIVFYLNRNNKPRTVMARWLTDEQAAETDVYDVGLEGGWYECIDNWDDYTEVAIYEGEPTHWMPLPSAPGTAHPPRREEKNHE